MRKSNGRNVKTDFSLFAVILFALLAFGLLALREETFDFGAVSYAVAVPIVTILVYALMLRISRNADRILIVIVAFLISIGLVLQYRMSPETALRQSGMIGIGIVMMAAFMLLMRKPDFLKKMSIIMALGSLVILGALLFVGKESGGAKNWINIAGILFQPSEFVKVALVFVLAGAMDSHTSLRELMPTVLFVFAAIGLLVMQRDLGAALLMAGTFLIMFYVATGKLGQTMLGLLAGGAGAVASYFMFDHVKARVAVWIDPWATYDTSGYQIAQGLIAIASGGLFGMGLGMGSPKLIPAYHTDYIFAVVCEEFGAIFAIGLIALYLLIVVRGALIALNTNDRFTQLVAFGATAMLALQTFIIIAGVIKLIPLTGITLPFVSYGGSSVIASFMMVGILEGAACTYEDRLNEEILSARERRREP